MHPERVIRELLPEPPSSRAGTVTEICRAGLALQRRDHGAGTGPARAVLGRLRDDYRDVPGPAVLFPCGDDDADGADVRVALQLRQRAGLPPPEARAERGEPAEQIVRSLLADRASVARLYRLAA